MKRNIMLVDNSISVLETLKWLFADEPYYIFACGDPIEALGLIRLAEFAVVVADQSLQKMSGLEFMQKVKKRSPDTLGIIMKDSVHLEKVTGAIHKNVYGFVEKPLDNGELKHAVANALTHYDTKIANGRSKRPC
jgi:DNA-binding NtrC family response regulator